MIDIGVKAECTGAGNDQDRHSSHKAIGELRLGSPDRRGGEGQLHHTDHGRHEVAGDLVGQALDRGAAALGLGHELDNLRQHGVAPDLLGLDHPAAGLVHGPIDRPGPDLFGNRHGFPGDHGLVHRTASFDDHAVTRHLLARADTQAVADLNGVELDLLLGAVGHDLARRLECQVE
jgi:hypothetical protein